jgi:hypothetical protein
VSAHRRRSQRFTSHQFISSRNGRLLMCPGATLSKLRLSHASHTSTLSLSPV